MHSRQHLPPPPNIRKCSFCPTSPCTEGLTFPILRMWPFWVTHSVRGAVLPPRPKEPCLVGPAHGADTAAQTKTGR